MDALAIEDVVKTFGSVRAVDGLSARVPAGCVYGFLGPNGAGKTTTLRMAMNILSPDSGRIEVLGGPSSNSESHRIGYMPEERGLYRKMKVRAVASFFGALKGLRGRALALEVSQRIEEVELGAWADRRVEDLSRGMQQKLQFAVAALGKPDLMILDEPFSGLDPVNLDLITGLMQGMREAGKTIVYSTHIMEQAERLCDFILLIDRGKVVIDGALEKIRSSYQSNAVVAKLDGDTAFIEALPMVRGVKRDGRKQEIALVPGADPQDLLRALADKVRVRSFEEKTPSLHEIFVDLVGKKDA